VFVEPGCARKADARGLRQERLRVDLAHVTSEIARFRLRHLAGAHDDEMSSNTPRPVSDVILWMPHTDAPCSLMVDASRPP
jgi:hypothetical protein